MNQLLQSFHFKRWPEIHFGANVTKNIKQSLPDLSRVLWVTGGSNGQYSAYFKQFLAISALDIDEQQIVQIGVEPSPQMIDAICRQYQTGAGETDISAVVGIGGGSVVDAAKALSAMLVSEQALFDHLEGVGKGVALTGKRLPFIAIPTTSGTGSEMTTNAVFSEVGVQGYKKSIRHDNLLPDAIWVDPMLTLSCPPLQTACCGLDAFTQLLEAYLSTQSNLMTDMLAEQGLQLIIENLEAACGEGSQDPDVRGAMAMASLFSGACLAHAGLGIVHGIAGPMGGFFDIPHGVVCAGLVAKANDVTLTALIRDGELAAITKMARIGRLCDPQSSVLFSDEESCQQLINKLYQWQEQFQIPAFSKYGMQEADIDKMVQASSNRNNPVLLNQDEIADIIHACL